jgi:hypothetical protein
VDVVRDGLTYLNKIILYPRLIKGALLPFRWHPNLVQVIAMLDPWRGEPIGLIHVPGDDVGGVVRDPPAHLSVVPCIEDDAAIFHYICFRAPRQTLCMGMGMCVCHIYNRSSGVGGGRVKHITNTRKRQKKRKEEKRGSSRGRVSLVVYYEGVNPIPCMVG